MGSIHKFLWFILAFGLFSGLSCRKERPQGLTGTVEIKFKAQYGQEDFIKNETYPYAGGQISFSKVGFFISDLSITTSDGTKSVEMDDIDYIDFAEIQQTPPAAAQGWSKTFYSVPVNSYSGVQFHIGLNPEDNALNPKDFPKGSHPLSFSSRYSDEYKSYIFIALEGSFTKNGDSENFQAIVVGDDLYKKVLIHHPLEVGQDFTSLQVLLDLSQVFNQNNTPVWDILSKPEIAGPEEPLLHSLAQNAALSFRIE